MGNTVTPELTCSACGAISIRKHGSYEFAECGLPHVILHGVERITCTKCGNEDPVIPRINTLMRALAVAVVCKPHRLTGEDVRFLRKYLGMTSNDFARLLDVDKTNMSKWENNHDKIGAQSDRLIRLLTVALGDGLKDEMAKVIDAFPAIPSKRSKSAVQIRIDVEP